MKTDEELNESFSVTLDNNIVHFDMLKQQHDPDDVTRQAELAQTSILKHFDTTPNKRLNGLVNLVSLADARFLTNKAKNIYIDLISLNQLNKMAFVVPNNFSRVLTSLFTQFSGKWGHVKWFTNEKEAIIWLNKNQI
jgi:hypothetical protein